MGGWIGHTSQLPRTTTPFVLVAETPSREMYGSVVSVKIAERGCVGNARAVSLLTVIAAEATIKRFVRVLARVDGMQSTMMVFVLASKRVALHL
jgi:hypothetical protein